MDNRGALAPTFRLRIRPTGTVHDTNGPTYRCFLPDLTRFVSVCCAATDRADPQPERASCLPDDRTAREAKGYDADTTDLSSMGQPTIDFKDNVAPAAGVDHASVDL